MTPDEVWAAIRDIRYKAWTFVHHRSSGIGDRSYIQVRFCTVDSVTGKDYVAHGRKWLISPHMTKSEVVLTVFKAIMTAEEHEIRESFKYRGHAIFNPHIDVDALVKTCEHTDERMPA